MVDSQPPNFPYLILSQDYVDIYVNKIKFGLRTFLGAWHFYNSSIPMGVAVVFVGG